MGWSRTHGNPVVGWLDDEDGEGVVEDQGAEADVDAVAGYYPEDGGHEEVCERASGSHEGFDFVVDSTPWFESLEECTACRHEGLYFDVFGGDVLFLDRSVRDSWRGG